jgi:hypothetical protein
MKKGAAQNAEQAPAAGLLFGDWRDEVFAKTVGEAIGLWGIHLCERMRAERAAETRRFAPNHSSARRSTRRNDRAARRQGRCLR